MNVKDARAAVLEDLKAGGWYIKEENINHSVGHCYRCHTVIEPYLSEQWIVRMKPLAEKALAAWRRGEIIFYPKKWENTYERWLENIRDWCVSRQLWWGHRIPAWYCKDCGKTSVSRNDITKCSHCGSQNIEQDPDVLDTWFSSWLWPFSVLGWEGGSGAPPLIRFRTLLSDHRACYCLRHYFLLGVTHDNGGVGIYRPGSVPRRVYSSADTGQKGPQDEQKFGERH
jgi:valyl-tRNA synthetase